MIADFADQGTEDIFNRVNSPAARRTCPQQLHFIATKRLQELQAAASLNDLRLIRGHRLEMLRGARRGQYSIRINSQYRICFRWEQSQAGAVEITDYHG